MSMGLWPPCAESIEPASIFNEETSCLSRMQGPEGGDLSRVLRAQKPPHLSYLREHREDRVPGL